MRKEDCDLKDWDPNANTARNRMQRRFKPGGVVIEKRKKKKVKEESSESEDEEEDGESDEEYAPSPSKKPKFTRQKPPSPAATLSSPESPAHLPAVAADPPVPTLFAPFPYPLASSASMKKRMSREALTRVLLFGAEAPLEKLEAGVGGGRLLPQLLDCDTTYVLSLSSPLLSPFSCPSSPSIPPPTTPQARSALTCFFSLVEPFLRLFAREASKERFQAECAAFWQTGEANGRGWRSLYLATVGVGLAESGEKERAALGVAEENPQGWAEEASRALAADDFSIFPTLDGLRAALLLLHFSLAGLIGIPDVPRVLSVLPSVVSAAYELGLHRDPGDAGDEAEERRALWWRVVELEAVWAPLLDKRLCISPSSFSTLSPSSPSPMNDSSPSSTPLLPRLFTLSLHLSHLLNAPRPPSLVDLALLADEHAALARELEERDEQARLERLLMNAVWIRLAAVREEVATEAAEGDKEEWRNEAENLLANGVDLVLACTRFDVLLALATFLHSLVLLAVRLRDAPTSPLLPAFHALLARLKTSSFPLHTHQVLHRGIILLSHLLPASPSAPAAVGAPKAQEEKQEELLPGFPLLMPMPPLQPEEDIAFELDEWAANLGLQGGEW
ncbi:hypothetical protein JCM10213_001637 [Rhodosporidiobolus nylandii]